MKFFIGIGGGLLWLLLGICAWAGEDLKGEDLLDVLKQNRTITREQYESLKKKPTAEQTGKAQKGIAISVTRRGVRIQNRRTLDVRCGLL